MLLLIKNVQHNVLPDQMRVLAEFAKTHFDADWEEITEVIDVPATGLTKDEIFELANNLEASYNEIQFATVFVSPIPLLIKLLVEKKLWVEIFHNDKRDKKELPNGTVVYTVAKDGWQLV